ncbi:MAG: DegT/DnrJ/EryC1/StrS family aminotransferase, partial [Parcubacteria group bacterium]|nr:DegT/DnrJ/EryC1/StrS family aminotransferase [Parcubacteria group bacterium]
YNALLKDVKGIVFPPETSDIKNVFWMYSIKITSEFGISRDELRNKLADRGVETRTFFIPMHMQPIFYEEFIGQEFPVAEDLCKTGLYLPSSSDLTEEEIRYVSRAVTEIAENK